ncbi:NAD(P)H-binding protein [Nocardia ninae]|uniref:Nucleotide-diphosphate-sugar epimerase n=1 Tax=Nocardia ninae NBRC 108245 TaxID=1210091 RepID=A0A511MI40_9NOCA|nr:NAD(P)H-binding protein [Nocardia ninae]GEM40121.1 nucleotide-diphosphate-sugar epimerase [Nocardia ninae NBRC 108245]
MILVTGATGNIGGEVVTALSESGAPVRALVRDPATATLPAGVEAVTGDLNRPETMVDALDEVRALFLLPGYDNQADLLDRAKKAGVQRVVLLSSASAALQDLDNAVSRYMTLSERAVRESELAWTFLRPRSFMSNALRWLPQLAAGDVVRVQFPEVRFGAIDPADIAAVAALALTGDHLDGRTLELTGPQALLPADQIAILAATLDRPLVAQGLSTEETRAELSATMPQHYVEAFLSFFAGGTLDEATLHPTVQEVTGRAPRTFEQWAQAHAAAFTG